MKKTDSAIANSNIYDSYNAFKIGFVSDNLSHLLGEVLTVLDASTQGDQNKAMKDLVRRAFADKQSWFRELSWKYEESISNGHAPAQDWEKGIVPIELDRVYSFES